MKRLREFFEKFLIYKKFMEFLYISRLMKMEKCPVCMSGFIFLVKAKHWATGYQCHCKICECLGPPHLEKYYACWYWNKSAWFREFAKERHLLSIKDLESPNVT